MLRSRGWFWVVGAGALALLPSPALAADNLRIVDVEYQEHFNPGEPALFNVTLRNNELVARFAEVDIAIVDQATGFELTLVPVLTGTLAVDSPQTLSQTYFTNAGPAAARAGAFTQIPPGSYTVVFTLFDGNGDRCDQLRGKFPLQVGSETESLRVFPEAVNLGTLPPGRYMHPVPLEIRYSFFQFNRLRQNQPFAIRIYTDNSARYEGIPHAVGKVSPGGLVSMDGRYVIPLKCWSLNFGPDMQETGWDSGLAGPPPVDEDDIWIGPPLLEGGRNYGSAAWVRIPDLVDMTADPHTWRRFVGQDPYDSQYVSDSNPTGDFTLRSPFSVYLATETGPTAVEGTYAANLVVELWSP